MSRQAPEPKDVRPEERVSSASSGRDDAKSEIGDFSKKPGGRCGPTLLLVCVALVVFWEAMSMWSRRQNAPYELTAETMADFVLPDDNWRIESLPVRDDPLQPNVVVYQLRPRGGTVYAAENTSPVLVRLVHGYNMCDCMRIKMYKVELIRDTRDTAPVAGGAPASRQRSPSSIPQVQVWRLTSSSGDVSIWATSMLAAYDFAATSVDTRRMAFPKVGTPDDPSYSPRGITLGSLKHPIRNTGAFLHAHWNKSRCDPLTFLGLRKPAWASHEMLTLVTASKKRIVDTESEEVAIRHVLAAHAFVYRELASWRRRKIGQPFPKTHGNGTTDEHGRAQPQPD